MVRTAALACLSVATVSPSVEARGGAGGSGSACGEAVTALRACGAKKSFKDRVPAIADTEGPSFRFLGGGCVRSQHKQT